jgi:hypothetical protein
MAQKRQELLLICAHCVHGLKLGKFTQKIVPDWRPKTKVAVVLEVGPIWFAFISLQLKVPLLCRTSQMVRSKPDLFSFRCLLAVKKLFASIKPAQGILFPIKGRERELVKSRDVATI